MNNSNNNYHLYFEITNINLIKIVCDILCKISDYVRFCFTKQKNNDVLLKITCTNATKTYFLKSELNNKLICKYFCNLDKIEIIFSPKDLSNILKSYDLNDNLLLLYIKNDEMNMMVIEFTNIEENDEIENLENKNIKKSKKKSKNKYKKEFKFEINYPKEQEKQIVEINYDKKIFMNVKEFHEICNDLKSIFDNVKITSKNNKSLYFGYNISKCDGLIIYKYDNTNIILDDLNLKTKTISSIYCLKDIDNLSKLIDITTKFNFNIKDNDMLKIIYTLDIYGYIEILYIPIREDNITTLDFENISEIENSSNNNNILENNKKTINDKILYIEINKIELFKSLCECIEKIISEPIFKIECNNNQLKMKIECTNNSKNLMMDITIENIYERFKNLEKSINIGLSLKYLNDILKTINNTNLLILSIDKNDKHNLSIQIKKINNNLCSKKIYKIKLLNIDDNNSNSSMIKIDNYVKKIIISSNEFYNACKDINLIGEHIRIECSSNKLMFSSSSMEDCKYVNIMKKNIEIVNSIENEIKENNNIIGEYNIKDIIIFNKLSNFVDNNEFNLYLKNDKTLIIHSKLIESYGIINIQYLSKNEIKNVDLNLIESDIETMDNKLIFFKLKKINIMKNIVETLDKMISDVEWIFTSKKINNDIPNDFIGVEIICTDPSKTLYIKCKLNDELFKSYYCCKENLRFGMNMEYLNKILKLSEKDDIAICCYIEKTDPNNLIIRFKNFEKKNKKIFKLPSHIILNENINIPITLNFEKKIIINCNDFFSKCKMISNNSQFVEIECENNKLSLKCVGNTEGTFIFDNNENLEIINQTDDKVNCIYEIKNILMFSKLLSITDIFSLYMKNNFALTSIYSFGIYGSIITILSPINDEYINNEMYEYSDDENDDDIELINNKFNSLDNFL